MGWMDGWIGGGVEDKGEYVGVKGRTLERTGK